MSQEASLGAGFYQAELRYSGNGANGGAELVLAIVSSQSGETAEPIAVDGTAGTVRRIVHVPVSDRVWVETSALATVNWSVTLTKLNAPTSAVSSIAVSGTGAQSTGLYRLNPGTYSATVTYSGSTYIDGSAGIWFLLVGEDSFIELVDDETHASGSVTVNVTLRSGVHWFSAMAAGSGATWSVKLTPRPTSLKSATPTISGVVAAGQTLKAVPGAWTKGTKFSYQWYANGKAIKGATKASFKLTKAQKGKKISVKATGSLSGYKTVAKTSKATGKVATAAVPKIKGTVKVGKTLTVSKGSWTSKTKFSYTWLANGKAIRGATKAKLKLTTSHQGKTITVKVTGKKSGYATVSLTSKATRKVAGKAAAKKTVAKPGSGYNCPKGYPVKGNAESGIYHLPGDRYYKATKPEECFKTGADARAAGYRHAKA